jgi:hypothetical protein
LENVLAELERIRASPVCGEICAVTGGGREKCNLRGMTFGIKDNSSASHEEAAFM